MDVYANFALQENFTGAIFGDVPSFGENVRRLRKDAGLKRSKDLAGRLNVAASVVSRWETDATGLPEGPTLLRLAIALRCSVEDLLSGVDRDYDAIIAKRRRVDPADAPPLTRAQVEAAEAAAVLELLDDAERAAYLALLRPRIAAKRRRG